jgi:hypothetical protein
MVIFHLFAAIIGGALTVLILSPRDVLIAFLAAPLGGSAAVLLSGFLLHMIRPKDP